MSFVLGSRPVGSMYEHEVEVAGVSHFATSVPAQPEHCERDSRAKCLECCVDAGIGERSEIMTHSSHVGCAEYVAGGDTEQVALLPSMQRRLLVNRVMTQFEHGDRAIGQILVIAKGERSGIRKSGDQVGVMREDLSEQATGTGESAQALGRRRRITEHVDQLSHLLRTAEQVADDQQSEIRVG
ncbi:unannotated protein [freshwater metagenome]|uniref:Unannotated protein n=1 Tax=freshwater metagenome TaxID=449393 RepID=A0A6J5YCM2_9ZZZZ